MSRTLWYSLLVSPVIWGVALVLSDGAIHGFAPLSAKATETFNATETRKPTADSPVVSATSVMAKVSPTKQERLAVVDTKTSAAVNRGEGKTTVADTEAAVAATMRESKATVADPVLGLTPSAMTLPEVIAQNSPASVPMPTDANVLEPIESYTNEGSTNDTVEQVNSVTQLSDVQPTDWAYEALRSLVERYGCIAGYPNGTYRGNRAMSRYEFAAGLNA